MSQLKLLLKSLTDENDSLDREILDVTKSTEQSSAFDGITGGSSARSAWFLGCRLARLLLLWLIITVELEVAYINSERGKLGSEATHSKQHQALRLTLRRQA